VFETFFASVANCKEGGGGRRRGKLRGVKVFRL
jgi:hypothetical protein